MKTSKQYLTIFILLLLSFSSPAQKLYDSCLVSFSDSSSGTELWGFKTTTGKVAIKPAYEICATDTMFKMALVTLNFKWIAIDRQGNIMLTPYIFDNGPDYIQEGLFRYTEGDHIGFADKDGKKIIPATFEIVYPFTNGLAAFNIGGHLENTDEHSSWTGGLWGFINKKGKIVIEPKFIKVFAFQGQYCEAWTKGNKHVLINKKGEIYRVL